MNQQVVFTPETMEVFIAKLRKKGIIGTGGGGLISTIKVNGEKKILTTEPVVQPIDGGYNIEFNYQDIYIKI